MTYPNDHYDDIDRIQKHSSLSITVVSLSMIGAALTGLYILL